MDDGKRAKPKVQQARRRKGESFQQIAANLDWKLKLEKMTLYLMHIQKMLSLVSEAMPTFQWLGKGDKGEEEEEPAEGEDGKKEEAAEGEEGKVEEAEGEKGKNEEAEGEEGKKEEGAGDEETTEGEEEASDEETTEGEEEAAGDEKTTEGDEETTEVEEEDLNDLLLEVLEAAEGVKLLQTTDQQEEEEHHNQNLEDFDRSRMKANLVKCAVAMFDDFEKVLVDMLGERAARIAVAANRKDIKISDLRQAIRELLPGRNGKDTIANLEERYG